MSALLKANGIINSNPAFGRSFEKITNVWLSYPTHKVSNGDAFTKFLNRMYALIWIRGSCNVKEEYFDTETGLYISVI